ncbi:hypothetical protein ACFFLM_05875 [Deinococcus oregonensis]|uniref:Uncharacterized protein n=1 Tax=Deinococcus oregonensis TaxID=1805970 RepID=A0ABV6AY27_9DEIO
MTDPKPHRHRFPMMVIGHASSLDRRFPFSSRDIQKWLGQRGTEVDHERLCNWCIQFGSLYTEELRRREP